MTKLKLFVGDCLYENALQEIKTLILSTKNQSYQAQLAQIYNQHYANFGSYSRYFNSTVWEVSEVLVNSPEVQNLWRKDKKRFQINLMFWRLSYQFTKTAFLRRLAPNISPMHRTLLSQIREYKPNVVILTDLHLYPSSVLKKIKSQDIFLVGHISSQIREGTPVDMYDLLLSSFDEYLRYFQELGVESFKFLPAFDRECLPESLVQRDIDCVFVGSVYDGTAQLLSEVKKYVPQIQIFGPTLTLEMKELGLEENYRGTVFGNRMFEILARTRLVINRHGNPISSYGNVRNFEATGMGAGLLTEECLGLNTIFSPNEEVFTYRNIEDIGLRAKSILSSSSNLANVSEAGQIRTLASHTYEIRYKELEVKISSLLAKVRAE